MKTEIQRLNNIQGQIEGIKKMLVNGDDCIKVMTQLKAVKSAVAGVMDKVLDEQFEHCLKLLKTEDKKLLIKVKKYVEHN
jgi:CsoR family transcriptional regulator, copper-sensing transcriptional repressor